MSYYVISNLFTFAVVVTAIGFVAMPRNTSLSSSSSNNDICHQSYLVVATIQAILDARNEKCCAH